MTRHDHLTRDDHMTRDDQMTEKNLLSEDIFRAHMNRKHPRCWVA
jgi:hypothetical protein